MGDIKEIGGGGGVLTMSRSWMTASIGSRFGVYDVRPSRLHSSERVHREYVVKSVSVTVDDDKDS